MPTVKEGQAWASEFARHRADEMGLDIRTYWRTPANGMDWTFEMTAEEDNASVEIPVWFMRLKRLDEASKSHLQNEIREGLQELRQKLSSPA